MIPTPPLIEIPWSKDAYRPRLTPPVRDAYRQLQQERGDDVRIEHVRSHTGNRGNEAADKLANMGAEIEEGHRVVERGSAEPPPAQEEHIDNG